MAFNWATFKTRTGTAIFFAAVMLTGLLWNHWSFFVLFSIIHFGCWWEYLKLTEKIHTTSIHIYTKLGLMLAGYGLMLWFCGPVYQAEGYSVKENLSLPVSGAGFLLIIIGIFNGAAVNVKAFAMAMLGLIYISLSWGLMIDLYAGIEIRIHDTLLTVAEDVIPVTIIATMWINDTMAYIVGSLIGKTPLTKISPKKTWEGTIGGIVLAIIAVGFLAKLFFPTQYHLPGIMSEFEIYHWFIIPAVAAIAGTFGDLLESKLKRMAGVKDSGSIMPGHGGFLDRFDSLLLATPAVWLYVKLLML